MNALVLAVLAIPCSVIFGAILVRGTTDDAGVVLAVVSLLLSLALAVSSFIILVIR